MVAGVTRTVTLRDGTRVRLRPIQPDDKHLLVRGFERLSEDSRYRRFFIPMSELSPAQREYLTELGPSRPRGRRRSG